MCVSKSLVEVKKKDAVTPTVGAPKLLFIKPLSGVNLLGGRPRDCAVKFRSWAPMPSGARHNVWRVPNCLRTERLGRGSPWAGPGEPLCDGLEKSAPLLGAGGGAVKRRVGRAGSWRVPRAAAPTAVGAAWARGPPSGGLEAAARLGLEKSAPLLGGGGGAVKHRI